jgi:hypothetical protein
MPRPANRCAIADLDLGPLLCAVVVTTRAVNRRLDEWVTKERLNFEQATKPDPKSKKEEVRLRAFWWLYRARVAEIARGLQRGKKRKKQKHGDGDHGEHDDSAHEEATKIKNVQRIQFGKYMIDTWYYSPFPQVSKADCEPKVCEDRSCANASLTHPGVDTRNTWDTARCSSASSR